MRKYLYCPRCDMKVGHDLKDGCYVCNACGFPNIVLLDTPSPNSALIEAIDLFIALEHDKSQMIKDVFPRARALQPEWSGGSFYDALKILRETASYDLAMGRQDGLLKTIIGIERYYDVEGHDNTVDVLKLTKRILLYHSSHMLGKEDVVKSSQLGFRINDKEDRVGF